MFRLLSAQCVQVSKILIRIEYLKVSNPCYVRFSFVREKCSEYALCFLGCININSFISFHRIFFPPFSPFCSQIKRIIRESLGWPIFGIVISYDTASINKRIPKRQSDTYGKLMIRKKRHHKKN